MNNKGTKYGIILLLLILALTGANLLFGSVNIPAEAVWHILTGNEVEKASWSFIVWESRLPQAVTALLCGMALASSGLMLQTTFNNPLADPSILGISSGASLGVALVMLAGAGTITAGVFTLSGFISVIIGAFIGAMLVMGIITAFSAIVRSYTVLLIIGLMVGYLAGSAISLLNFFSTAEGVKSYLIWGMGSFGNVSMDEVRWFVPFAILGLLASLLLIKPLNAMLLGEQYAENLGFPIRKLRIALLVITGMLTAVVTAFCGPIAFIGLATPHIARLLVGTENHRQLLPVTMLMGAAIALLCNLLCSLPSDGGIIPLNAVTPLFGAPVIIYILIRRR